MPPAFLAHPPKPSNRKPASLSHFRDTMGTQGRRLTRNVFKIQHNPASNRPNSKPSLGGRYINASGASRREGVNVCLDVIASEAKQSISPRKAIHLVA